MPRRPAAITQADVARLIRAARQEGAPFIELYINGTKARIPVSPQSPADATPEIDREPEIVL